MAEQKESLSERELEILRLLATGASNNEIAAVLSISPNTVKVHVRNIFGKLGVASRTEATTLAIRLGLITVEKATELPTPAEGLLLTGEPPTEPNGYLPGGETPAPVLMSSEAGPAEVQVSPGDSSRSLEGDEASSARRPLSLARRLFLVIVIGLAGLGTAATWPRAQGPCQAELTECQPTALPSIGGQPSRWAERAPLSAPRSRLALAAVNEKLFAVAGATANGTSDAVEIYDSVHNQWSPGTDKPTAVENVSAAVISNTIIIPGGFTAAQQPTARVEVYDPGANSWVAVSPMPGPLSAYAIATFQGRVYVFGGQNGQQYTGKTYIYDPARDGWTVGADMPTRRGFAAAAEADGQIYVVGGFDGQREYNTCERYNPASNSWSTCAPMEQPRGGIGAVTLMDQIYVVGGGWTGYLSFNERYDPATNSWSRFDTPISLQWRNAGVAALDGDIFVVGGVSGEPLSIVRSYQAIYKLYLPAAHQK